MYLGLDIGTSSVKAVLVDAAGRVAAVASRALDVSHPHLLWSEQNPEDWVEAAVAAVDELASTHSAAVAAVRGVGLSGQMHGATLLDAKGTPLRPAILWNDGRSHLECRELEARLPELPAISGNLAMPGFTAPKLLWVRKHEPEIFARTAKVLLPKAYVRFRLTGEMVEDMSDASGTLWLNVGQRQWSEEILAACGMSLAQMPSLVEGSAASGRLTASLTARWGMRPGVVVAGGAGDCAASAIGLGAIAPGQAFLSLGTSGVLFAVTDRFAPNAASAVHAFCHAIPGTWHQMGVMLSAAASLAWLAGILGTREAELLKAFGAVVDVPSPVKFLPYLSGERTPLNDAEASGLLAGLRSDTSRSEIVQAVLEGVAFAARDNLRALAQAGTHLTEIDLVGGGSRSPLWAQIVADVLDLPVHRVEEGEVGAALGAARLGRLADTGEAPADVCTPPRRLATLLPRPVQVAAYNESHAQWSKLYPALKEIR